MASIHHISICFIKENWKIEFSNHELLQFYKFSAHKNTAVLCRWQYDYFASFIKVYYELKEQPIPYLQSHSTCIFSLKNVEKVGIAWQTEGHVGEEGWAASPRPCYSNSLSMEVRLRICLFFSFYAFFIWNKL